VSGDGVLLGREDRWGSGRGKLRVTTGVWLWGDGDGGAAW